MLDKGVSAHTNHVPLVAAQMTICAIFIEKKYLFTYWWQLPATSYLARREQQLSTQDLLGIHLTNCQVLAYHREGFAKSRNLDIFIESTLKKKGASFAAKYHCSNWLGSQYI